LGKDFDADCKDGATADPAQKKAHADSVDFRDPQ
jgi:hypothetical protein